MEEAYEYSIKETIKDLDYLEFKKRKEIQMDRAMRKELNKFLYLNHCPMI